MAAASGLSLIAEDERDAWNASTYGTGQLIADAVGRGAQVILVAVGGSATTDGGAGALQAIEEAGGLRGAKIVVLSDVQVPWERCAEVFGPQKGADPEHGEAARASASTSSRRRSRATPAACR